MDQRDSSGGTRPLAGEEDLDSEPPSLTRVPTVALRFKEYEDVVTIPYDVDNSQPSSSTSSSSSHTRTSKTPLVQLSFSVWIYCENDASLGHEPCYLLAKKGSFALGLRSVEIAVAFHNKRPGWQWIGSRWKVPLREWTHITVTYDGLNENACVYANGLLVSTHKVTGKLKGSGQPLLVGVELKPENGPRTRFRGLISQVTLWKIVIDHETIAAHMSENITGNERGLLGHWPMKEGVGEVIADATPNATHGTITGASWWLSSESVGHVEIPLPTLMDDMKRMFNAELGSDVKLIASDADGRIIHAHKIILATRSEAFRALLFGGMKESAQKEVRFPDINYEVLYRLVQFLYTDNADITGDVVVGLFMAADQYQLLRLRALCENYILQNISLDNVCTIYQTANQLQATKLKGFCFNWIINNFGDILCCETYTTLPPELLLEINQAAAALHFSKKRRITRSGESSPSPSASASPSTLPPYSRISSSS